MKQKAILIPAFFTMPVVLYFSSVSDSSLATFVSIGCVLGIFWFCLMMYGLVKKKKVFILTFPALILGILLCYLTVNWQLEINYKNANVLIKSLERYKLKNGRFPKTLQSLELQYVSDVPKEWFGLKSRDFVYVTYDNDKSFSFQMRLGRKPYRTYESSLGTWQFLD